MQKSKDGLMEVMTGDNVQALVEKLPLYKNGTALEHVTEILMAGALHESLISIEINTSPSLLPIYAQSLPTMFRSAHRHIVLVDSEEIEELVSEYYDAMGVEKGVHYALVNLDGLNLEEADLTKMASQEFNGVALGMEDGINPRYAILSLAPFYLGDGQRRFPVMAGVQESISILEGGEDTAVYAYANVFYTGMDGKGISFDLAETMKFVTTTVNEQLAEMGLLDEPFILTADVTNHVNSKMMGSGEEENAEIEELLED